MSRTKSISRHCDPTRSDDHDHLVYLRETIPDAHWACCRPSSSTDATDWIPMRTAGGLYFIPVKRPTRKHT